ncbi:P-loop containing nucleoside triphosphate hydrolase protein, partial [Rhodocollybia butyracea]
MRRRNESQALLSRNITGSGKTSNLLHKIVEQVNTLGIVLDSFGNLKTIINPNASRHGRYTELHFNERERISDAKVLISARQVLSQSSHPGRAFLACILPFHRRMYFRRTGSKDPSDYTLLASSGTYRLPVGPFDNDSVATGDLRAAMRTLGFKPKAASAIFGLLIIHLLENLEFGQGNFHDVSAHVTNVEVLDHVFRLLGVSRQVLT